MKWYHYTLLIVVFSTIFFFFGRYTGKVTKILPTPISIISKTADVKLTDSISKLTYKLTFLNKSLIKALGFKPTLNKIDTIPVIIESIKEDTSKINYLEKSLIKSLETYVTCLNINSANDSLIRLKNLELMTKDTTIYLLSNDNNVLKQKVKDRNKLLGIISGSGSLLILSLIIL